MMGVQGPSLMSMARILARDRDLLEAGRPAAAVALVAEDAVTFGVAHRDDDPFARAARRAGVAVLRRSTGGGGLLHLRGDLTWSIVLPRGDPRVGRTFIRAFPRLGAPVVSTLSDLGLGATWSPASRSAEPYCLLSGRGEVLRVGDRAIGGAAQHLSGSALLHHGTVNATLDPDRLHRIFGLAPDLVGRELTDLAADPAHPTAEAVAERLAVRLGEWLPG